VDQWPLTGEKLAAAQALVQKQLQAGHIETFHSSWNTPTFVIKKKSGRWHLLQDLRATPWTFTTWASFAHRHSLTNLSLYYWFKSLLFYHSIA
jgi:hypothetical protein